MAREPGCIFCGASGLTNEDAWPRWMRHVFYLAGPEIVHELLDQDGKLVRLRSSNKIDVRVRRACHKCNNVWMGGMEDATKPIIEKLIRGEPTTLTTDDQSRIAKWLTKTGMTVELATENATIPLNLYRAFRSQDSPLDFTIVLLSSIADEAGPTLSYMKQDGPLELHLRSDLPAIGSPEGVVQGLIRQRAECYLQTFRLGAFVAQLFWTDSVDLAQFFALNELSNGHIRAWPDPTEEMWPTTRIVDVAALNKFAARLFLLPNKGA